MSHFFGRLSAILLIVSLVLGPVATHARASSMVKHMPMTAISVTHATGSCNDCAGSKKGVPVTACSMYCVGMVALMPEGAAIDENQAGKQEYYALLFSTEHDVRLDPYDVPTHAQARQGIARGPPSSSMCHTRSSPAFERGP